MAAPLTNDSGAARRRSDREHGADLAPVLAFLPCRTPEAWLEAAGAAANLPTLLVDHANCEKKAAATALNLMYRYVEHPALLHRLSRLAREELRHFEQVLAIIEARASPTRRCRRRAMRRVCAHWRRPRSLCGWSIRYSRGR
jgi:tRNA-(ms[2]io[6]A)-hydroxylase